MTDAERALLLAKENRELKLKLAQKEEELKVSYGKHKIEDDPDFDPEQEQVYGGVWTDKGLVFIAKKNKKGEWEIL